MTMFKKKQGFITKHVISPAQPLIRIAKSFKGLVPLLGEKKLEFDSWAVEARKKLKNPAATNFELGKEFFLQGKISDAITRLKLATYLDKGYAEAYFWLGKSYIAKYKIVPAKECFDKARSLKFESNELEYFYEIYNKENINFSPSHDLSRSFFERFAKVFNKDYISYIEYQGIEKMLQAYQDIDNVDKPNILELGCGAGLLGKRLKEYNNYINLTGLDYAKAMIEKAREVTFEKTHEEEIIDLNKDQEAKVKQNKIYDYLIRADFVKFQNRQNSIYDVVIARGMFGYIKDVNKVAKTASKLISKNGYLLFFVTDPYKQEFLNEIKKEYSYPFFCNHHNHTEEQIKDAFLGSSFELQKITDFPLEKKATAKLFTFKHIG